MNKLSLTFTLLLALPLSAATCAKHPKEEPTPTEAGELQRSADAFHNLMRWAYIDRASLFIPAGDPRSTFESEASALFREVRITNYRVVSAQRHPAHPENATVKVEITRFSETELVERTSTHEEEWFFDATDRMWRLTSPVETSRLTKSKTP